MEVGGGGGKREITYQSLHRHHQNDSCIKMGSDESHFIGRLLLFFKATTRALMVFTFVTFIGRFPSDGAASMAVKGLTPICQSSDERK